MTECCACVCVSVCVCVCVKSYRFITVGTRRGPAAVLPRSSPSSEPLKAPGFSSGGDRGKRGTGEEISRGDWEKGERARERSDSGNSRTFGGES